MDHMGLHYGALDIILWAPTIILYKLEIDIFAHRNYIMIHRSYFMVHLDYIIISGGNSMVHMGMVQTGHILWHTGGISLSTGTILYKHPIDIRSIMVHWG